MGITIMALALAAGSVLPTEPPPPAPIVYDEPTLCALVQPSTQEDRPRPVRVYTTRIVRHDKEFVRVNACMVAPVHERSQVTVQFQVFDPRLHFWTELGQTSCNSPDSMERAECHAGHWLAGADWCKEDRPNLQRERMPFVLIWVRWVDCDASSATFNCTGTDRHELYLMPTVELPALIKESADSMRCSAGK